MNTKLLIFSSFFIALLCHLFVFNFFTVIFSIDPAEPKPKFFFLGPILKQSDVDHNSSEWDTNKSYTVADKSGLRQTEFENMHYQTTDPEKNPFTIQTIKKPLLPQTTETQEKVLMKSTFQAETEEASGQELKAQDPDQELNIQPYRPLRSRLP